MPTTVLVTTLSLGGIIAVTLGSAVVLFAVILFLSLLIIHRRHKRTLAELERGLVRTPEASKWRSCAQDRMLSHSSNGIAQELYGRTISSENSSLVRGKTADIPNRRGHKRKPEILSWPLPRRRPSKRGVSTRAMIVPRLSAVIESPRGFEAVARLSPEETNTLVTLPLNTSIATPSNPGQRYGSDGIFRFSNEPATWPPPRRTKGCHSTVNAQLSHLPMAQSTKLDRSCSLPTLLRLNSDVVISKNLPERNAASTIGHSITSYDMEIENCRKPLPVLPLFAGRHDFGLHGKLSGCTNSTAYSNGYGSTNFGIFGDSPCETYPQRGELNAGDDETLQQNRQSRDRVIERLELKAPISLRETIDRSSGRKALLESPDWCSVIPSPSAKSQFGQILTAESVRLSRISNESGSGDSATVIRVLSTPKRNTQMRRVSACGSPPEKMHPSVLRDISGNELIPSRNWSQTSLSTFSSQGTGSNPFKWESPIQPKRSALKGSPTSRSSHKGRNARAPTVRIASKATVYPIPNQSAYSPSTGRDFSEEAIQNPLRMNGDVTKFNEPHTGSSTTILPQPPSTPVFAPELQDQASHARLSFTPSSPTLSHVPHLHRYEIPEASDFDDLQKGSSDYQILPPISHDRLAPGHTTYLSFPITSSESKHPSFEEIPLHIPDSPTIPPGLSLLRPTHDSRQGSNLFTAALNVQNRSGGNDLRPPSPTLDSLEQTESFDPTLPFSAALSPLGKASAATNVDTADLTTLSVRLTPLSSRVDPSNTESPRASTPGICSKTLSHPVGPRPAPGQPVVKIIRALRRENSDTQHMMGSLETRRYMRIESEGTSGSTLAYTESVTGDILQEVEEEAQQTLKRLGSIWEDTENDWERPALEVQKECSAGMGGHEIEINGTRALTREPQQSLYDTDGFLFL